MVTWPPTFLCFRVTLLLFPLSVGLCACILFLPGFSFNALHMVNSCWTFWVPEAGASSHDDCHLLAARRCSRVVSLLTWSSSPFSVSAVCSLPISAQRISESLVWPTVSSSHPLVQVADHQQARRSKAERKFFAPPFPLPFPCSFHEVLVESSTWKFGGGNWEALRAAWGECGGKETLWTAQVAPSLG